MVCTWRLWILAAVLAAAACRSGPPFVIVTIEDGGTTTRVTHLQITGTFAGEQRVVDTDQAGTPGWRQSLSFELPRSARGDVTVRVVASDAGGQIVDTQQRLVTVSRDDRYELEIAIGSGLSDGGPLADGGADALTDGATEDAACVAHCSGSMLVSSCGSRNCTSGCVAADATLPAHCALTPANGAVCTQWRPAIVFSPGATYRLAISGSNQPLLIGPSTGVIGTLTTGLVLFCFESIGGGPAVLEIDGLSADFPLPIALVSHTTVNVELQVIGRGGAADHTAVGQGVAGGGDGATSGLDAFDASAAAAGMMRGGGGGGGNAVAGMSGGNSELGSGGGAGGASLSGLVGGGGGAGGAGQTTSGCGGGGGGGGGGFQLTALTSLTFAGSIDVGGGGGGGGTAACSPFGGGGGGGAGGSIWLEAPQLTIAPGACLSSAGGAGGAGAQLGMDGKSAGAPDSTCPFATRPAVGAGSAGGGGVEQPSSIAAGAATASDGAGGGGGGAHGRIVVRSGGEPAGAAVAYPAIAYSFQQN